LRAAVKVKSPGTKLSADACGPVATAGAATKAEATIAPAAAKPMRGRRKEGLVNRLISIT
jgi:hypothetical protein